MNIIEYLDEVKLRLPRVDVVNDLNDPLICTYINKARRQVQYVTLGLYPYKYGKIKIYDVPNFKDPDTSMVGSYSDNIIDMYKVLLDQDMIEPHVVILQWKVDGVTYSEVCRRMDKREMFSVQMHSFNVPTIDTPVYSIERDVNTVPNWYLYLSGLSWNISGVDGSIFDTADYVKVMIYYTAAIDDMERVSELYVPNTVRVSDTETVISPELHELVIYYALLYCLQHVNILQTYPSVNAEINKMLAMLKVTSDTDTMINIIELPSKEVLQ